MIARVKLWGRTIGAVSFDQGEEVARFQYDPEFVGSRIEISPLTMRLSNQVYEFPALRRESFHGLPGMLADSLPDKFGHALIDAWLATQGRATKNDNFVMEDLDRCARAGSMKRGRAKTILDEVVDTVRNWPNFADKAGLPPRRTKAVGKTHRLNFSK